MRTKGHQFRTYSKPDPGVQAAKASMAFQAPPQDHDPSQGSSLPKNVSDLLAEASTGETVIATVDMPTGNLDLSTVDTTPGANCAMAPPKGVGLNTELYRDLIRGRYRHNPEHRQHMILYAKHKAPCSGPWAEQASDILSSIRGDK